MNRKQFLEELISMQMEKKQAPPGEDPVFKKYANKALPASRKTTTTLTEYTGTWTDVQVRHLIRRTMFGVKYADVQTLLGMSMSDAVDLLLNNTPAAPAPPVNDYSPIGGQDFTGVLSGETWVNAPFGGSNLNVYRSASYKAWWLKQIANQTLSITEKMVFFWHNHFATETTVVLDALFCYVHNVLLRSNALGNFKTLVKSVTKDPAMLRYLSGYENTKNAPDENYGRELQELFTVGKNNSPNYTEDDVKAAAHILTGWTIDIGSTTSIFVPQLHDTTDKIFSSFYNNTVIAGQSGTNGATETDELIDMIFTKQETALFICSKLYRFFIYYNIDVATQTNIIEPMAAMLISNNFEIKPVLQTLLKSEHFFDANNMGCYIKTPLDLIGGIWRTFNITIPSGADVTESYAIYNYLRNCGAELGLDLGDAPNVAGWPAYYEAPAYYELWVNSSTFPLRMELADMLLSTGFSAGTAVNIGIDIVGFIQQCPHPEDPDALITWLTALLLGIDVANAEHNALKNILLSGETNNAYWTDAWEAYFSNPDMINTNIVETRLAAMMTTLLRLPEFQLC